ncbi:S41 family peptidase [Sorangium sp. So ce131]|uniref:S41 family peptidase n=1 Tax=Sorangium sp. So ce131 TaxID=3133282 RepID=UPI003F61C8B2
MLPVNNKGAGLNAGFPDVCLSLVPGGPFPFPNFSPNAMFFPFSATVVVSGLPVLTIVSTSPITMGDQMGSLHYTFMGPARHTVGNPRVLVNFFHVTTFICPRTGNAFNCMIGVQVLPSVTNVFVTYNGGVDGEARPAGGVMAADVDALIKALHACGSTSPVESGWLAPGVGYLRISTFSLDVPARVHTAVSALQEQGLESLVVDVRGNPGGELTAFLELAGDFLEPGSVLARAVDADGDEIVYRARHQNPWRMPLRILVDRGTASAAELFAGCLQWHGRAVVAGERTYGKGTALKLVPEPTTAEPVLAPAALMTLPGGEAIHAVGVTPDIEIVTSAPS